MLRQKNEPEMYVSRQINEMFTSLLQGFFYNDFSSSKPHVTYKTNFNIIILKIIIPQ